MEKFFKHPWVAVGVIALITVFFALQLPKVEMENNNINLLPKENQARINLNYVDDTFGGQAVILVGLERPFCSVFEEGFLARVREFVYAVEGMELVKSIDSIISTQYITGIDDSIIVTDLVPEDFAGTPEEIAELRLRIASWDLYQGFLISENFSATQVLITLNVRAEDVSTPMVSQTLLDIRNLAGNIFTSEETVYFTGLPVINDLINAASINDIVFLIPFVIIVVLLMLFISFRRLIFVVLPLLTVIIAVIWAIGITPLLGIKLSVLTTILPIIIIAVGSAYSIHMITHYSKGTQHKILTHDEHRDFVFELVRKLIKPVFLAAITTIAGFTSLCFTPIIPMQEFGICGAIGVFVAFIMTVLLVPTLLLLRGPRTMKDLQKIKNGNDYFSNNVANTLVDITNRKILVLFFSVLFIGISIYGSSKIIVDNILIEYFQNETDISRSDEFIREYFGGSKDISLVVTADTTEELLHPNVLKAMDNLSVYLTKQVPAVGNVIGFTGIIKRVNQVFNVGESPSGLQPARRHNESDSFGFGDFGFGDFGFNFDDGNDFYHETETGIAPTSSHNITQYSVADLFNLLSIASGVSPRLSGNDLVRELQRLTNIDGMAYYEIPFIPERYGQETLEELRGIIENYLIFLAGNDDFGFSNDPLEPTAIKTLIQLRTIGNRDTNEVIDLINEYIAANFPENVQVIISGNATVEGAITDLIVQSSLVSIAISVILVSIIIAIFNKSLTAGFIVAITLAMAILCNFAIMGFTGIKLNIGTALIGSLTIGIGNDYAIHFIESLKREYKQQKQNILLNAYASCGKAIIINALSVGAGFAVLAFSQFRVIAELGIIIALCMVITAFISLTVTPVLATIMKPKFIYGNNSVSR